MAVLCPHPDRTPAIRDGGAVAAATRDAEAAWRALIDAQAADLRTCRRFWPRRDRPEVVAAEARLKARAEPGGAADEAIERVREAYGGTIPLPVRRRLDRYVVAHLHGGLPPAWPDRAESESTDEPALLRKQRRGQRG